MSQEIKSLNMLPGNLNISNKSNFLDIKKIILSQFELKRNSQGIEKVFYFRQ